MTGHISPFKLVHRGQCASGLIRGDYNQGQQTIADCAMQCMGNRICGYFAYDSRRKDCAIYTVSGGCTNDGKYSRYDSYQLALSGTAALCNSQSTSFSWQQPSAGIGFVCAKPATAAAESLKWVTFPHVQRWQMRKDEGMDGMDGKHARTHLTHLTHTSLLT